MYTQGGTLITPIVIHPNSPVPVQAHSRRIDRGISISKAHLGIGQASSVGPETLYLDKFEALHRGAFCQFPFWWIYYYGSNKSTGKETGKMHLCAVVLLV